MTDISGGVAVTEPERVYDNECYDCHHVWHSTELAEKCPSCGSDDIEDWPLPNEAEWSEDEEVLP